MLRDRLEWILRSELRGQARRERRVLQVSAIDEIVDREQAIEVDGPRNLVEVVTRELEMLEQILGELLGAVVRDLEPHRVAIAPFEQLALEGMQQVVDVLVVDV